MPVTGCLVGALYKPALLLSCFMKPLKQLSEHRPQAILSCWGQRFSLMHFVLLILKLWLDDGHLFA